MEHGRIAGQATPTAAVKSGATDRLGGTMKRTAATFLMVAGLGGCVSPDSSKAPSAKPKEFNTAYRVKEVPGVVGPNGAPVAANSKGGVVPASGMMEGDVTQTGHARVIGGGDCAGGCDTGACGGSHNKLGSRFSGMGHKHGYDAGPMVSGAQLAHGTGGILPAPSMGPWGAVAGVGMVGPGGPRVPMYADARSSIRFANPAGMKVSWLGPAGFTDATALEAPARYNFPQGNVYRLKLTGIPNRPGATYYPTLEVYPANPKTIKFLSHNTVPVAFTDEDFDQVRAGNLVTKVIYLPSETFQDLAAVAGAEEVVSTRLEPGVDPIVEANRRGYILAVVSIGNIDLQDPNTPAMDAPTGIGPRGPVMAPPGGMPAPGMPVPMPGAPISTPAPLPSMKTTASPKAPAPISLPSLSK